jgi:chromosomal replication initiation ATPase DnaA
VLPNPWEQLQAGLVLGSREFVEGLAERIEGDHREQPALRHLPRRPSLEQIIAAAEKVTGERWESLRDRHGDWRRDGVMLLGRDWAGATLRELGRSAGGIDYSSVSVAISRFQKRLAGDRALRARFNKLEAQMQNEKM